MGLLPSRRGCGRAEQTPTCQPTEWESRCSSDSPLRPLLPHPHTTARGRGRRRHLLVPLGMTSRRALPRRLGLRWMNCRKGRRHLSSQPHSVDASGLENCDVDFFLDPEAARRRLFGFSPPQCGSTSVVRPLAPAAGAVELPKSPPPPGAGGADPPKSPPPAAGVAGVVGVPNRPPPPPAFGVSNNPIPLRRFVGSYSVTDEQRVSAAHTTCTAT